MKTILIPILLSAIISFSCICGGGQPVQPAPVSNDYKYLFIFTGESNSGGLALNSSATAGELSPTNKVQILNNSTYSFENLDIGTNNNIGHTSLACCTSHGWELQLINRVTSNSSFYKDTVYLVKTGQGGSHAYSWNVHCGNVYCDSTSYSTYFGYFYNRVTKADSLLRSKKIRKVIFMSIGINDILAGTNVDSFKVQVIRNIRNFRAVTRDTTPVIMTKFFGTVTRYNNAIDSIANNSGLPKVYCVNGDGAPLQDPYHWNYLGMKTIADRILNKVEEIFTQ